MQDEENGDMRRSRIVFARSWVAFESSDSVEQAGGVECGSQLAGG